MPSLRSSGAEPEPAPEEPKFTPFTGSGKRLDGKAPKTSPSPSTGAAAAAAARAGTSSAPPRTGANPAPAAAPAEAPRRASGKLVFGAGGAAAAPKVSCVLQCAAKQSSCLYAQLQECAVSLSSFGRFNNCRECGSMVPGQKAVMKYQVDWGLPGYRVVYCEEFPSDFAGLRLLVFVLQYVFNESFH